MEQDPRYLSNRSRDGHERCRRYQRRLNVGTIGWELLFAFLFIVSLTDRLAARGWGFADGTWVFLGFMVAGVVLWFLNTAINKLLLAYIRHTYGPTPSD